jgi:hypothetical protein
MMMSSGSAAPTPRLNAPSGIAQLRKSSEQNYSQPEPMNLDDFIYADSLGTPVDYSSPQPLSKQMDESRSGLGSHPTLTSAIPIKSRRDEAAQAQQQDQFVPQSVPFPPQHQQKTRDEFNYLPRHTRKTSIDERRVSFLSYRPRISFQVAAIRRMRECACNASHSDYMTRLVLRLFWGQGPCQVQQQRPAFGPLAPLLSELGLGRAPAAGAGAPRGGGQPGRLVGCYLCPAVPVPPRPVTDEREPAR